MMGNVYSKANRRMSPLGSELDTRRVYDQCESVASFRSDEAELCRLQHRFERIKLNTWMLGYMICHRVSGNC